MTESAHFWQTRMHFHLNMIFKRMRMERVLSWGSFCGIESVKLFMNIHLSATWIRQAKCRYCRRLEKFLGTLMQLTDVRNDPFIQALFSQTAWMSFGDLLTNPIRWSVSKPSK